MFEQKPNKNSNSTLQNIPKIKCNHIDRRHRKKGSIKLLIRTIMKENKGRFIHKSLPMKYYGRSRERESRQEDNSDTEDELKKLILTVFAQNSIDYIRNELPRNNLPTLVKNLKKELKKDSLPASTINDLFPKDPYPVRYNDTTKNNPQYSEGNPPNEYQPNSNIKEIVYEPTDIHEESSYLDINNFDETY